MYKKQSNEKRKKNEKMITLDFVGNWPLAWSHDEKKRS